MNLADHAAGILRQLNVPAIGNLPAPTSLSSTGVGTPLPGDHHGLINGFLYVLLRFVTLLKVGKRVGGLTTALALVAVVCGQPLAARLGDIAHTTGEFVRLFASIASMHYDGRESEELNPLRGTVRTVYKPDRGAGPAHGRPRSRSCPGPGDLSFEPANPMFRGASPFEVIGFKGQSARVSWSCRLGAGRNDYEKERLAKVNKESKAALIFPNEGVALNGEG